MRTIEILGTGCGKCRKLEENARAAVAELGIDAEVVKVTDIDTIVDRGVMMTPALVVDGNVAVAGRVASAAQIRDLLA